MLRNITCRQLKTRITPAVVTSVLATTSISASVGNSNIASLTRSTSPIRSVITMRRPSRQNLVWVASQGTNNGGFVSTSDSSTSNVCSVKINDSTGTASDGISYVLACATDSPTVDSIPNQKVLCAQDRSRIIFGKVNRASVSMDLGYTDFAVTSASTGVYDITFKKAFGRAPTVLAMACASSYRTCKVGVPTRSGVTISCYDATPTAQNTDFYIVVLGTDSIEETGRGRGELLNSQRKPRIIPCQITVSGGTPSVTVGSKLISVTDNGAGDYTITPTNLFKRAYAAVATSADNATDALCAICGGGGTTTIDIHTRTVAGAKADPTGPINIFLIGSDDQSEY